MPQVSSYRFTFFDDETHAVTSVLVVFCPEDATAAAMARKLLRSSNHLGVEVWQGSRQVFTDDNDRSLLPSGKSPSALASTSTPHH